MMQKLALKDFRFGWFLPIVAVSVLLVSCGDDDDPAPPPPPPNLLCGNSGSSSSSSSLNLHVASPDWREQIIYFVMIDRFNDANPSNNDQAGYYNPSLPSHYSGGDLQGITEKVDYIKGLGATAVWITPPVANQWWDPVNEFSGYHGYWARHHKRVDEHYGSLDDYKNLSSTLHNNDMYLIQDIVPNHVGNYFHYTGAYDPQDTTKNFEIIANNVPVMAPIQEPFNLNDRNNPAHITADIYHWTPPISNFNNQVQEYTYQLADLDDVNTENPAVIAALKDSFGCWIREVGVDGFRVDTVKFVDHPFWNEFFHSSDGIEATARASGRMDFLHFGEVFEVSMPMADAGEVKIASFEGTDAKPELKSLLGFPLYGEIGRVFSGGAPPEHLRYRLNKHMEVYGNPFIVPNFIDNHDTARFLASGTIDSLRQALTTLFTIPGIPVIWQGTEQALRETRQTMFAGGNGTTTDQFNTDSQMYKFIQKLAQIRTSDPVWTRGELEVLAANPARPGALMWRRSLGNENAFVVMNTGDRSTLLNVPATGISTGGTILTLLMGVNHEGDVTLNSTGGMVLELAARAVLVLKASAQTGSAGGSAPTITVNENIAGMTVGAGSTLTGTVTPAATALRLVLDGDLSRAVNITPDGTGAWSVAIPKFIFSVSDRGHIYEVYDPRSMTATAPVSFSTAGVRFTGAGTNTADPRDDDNGPDGAYTYPQDETFSRQQDMTQMAVEHIGSALRLTFTMREISTVWNPNNGFDHVSFHIYFDLPDSEGVAVMPEQQSEVPAGFLWDIGQRTYGWGNQVFGSAGATEIVRGSNIASSPVIEVDEAAKTVTFLYDGLELGVESWEGAKIYATTWDIDGIEDVLRPITMEGAQWMYGGGASDAPKIMDSIGPVTVSAAPAD